jgi:hypothetical protein
MVLVCNRQSITPCTMPPKHDPVWEHFLVADGKNDNVIINVICVVYVIT